LEIGEIGEPDLEITSTSIWLQLLLLIGRELVRSFLAFALLGLLFVTVWSTLGKVGKPAFKDAKELLEVLLPAETALLGSVMGFFFGREVSRKQ